MFIRQIEKQISRYLQDKNDHKIFFIWGPRRSGKTTLLKKISAELHLPLFNFDLISDWEKFMPDKSALGKITHACPVILIDEVQNYEEATLALKILFDEFKIKIIATGSSELRQKSKHFDSLAGRFTEHFCLPLSLEEIKSNADISAYEEKGYWRDWLAQNQIFGSYPEVVSVNSENEKIELLQNILDSYVLKDIINIYNLRNTKLAKDILTKIALQIGQEVSLRELAGNTGANVATVSNYVEIFIKNYILLPLPAFKTNIRRAVSAHRKYYFLDLGLRNILVKDFRPADLRPDKGSVFENLIAAEIYKKVKNEKLNLSLYFYREYNGKEVDFVLKDYQKKYLCLESKLKSISSAPIFPLPHKLKIINAENYFDIIKEIK